jgi:type 1 glutamine amidotransferase
MLHYRRNTLHLALFLWLLASSPSPAADNSPPPGFAALFNGKDLAGWKVPEGDGGHWKVVDGVIDYDAESEAKGDKSLWTEKEYGDFVLQVDWRLKEAPFLNKSIPYILPNGTHAKDVHGKELRLPMPDADSGVFLRGDGFYQANIWCWPIGSGEIYSIRTDPKSPPTLKAAATPIMQADNPVGEWNHFEITVKGKTVTIALNGKTVIPGATIPSIPARGRLAFQHHGSKKDGVWVGPPSLVQFKNVYIKELPESGTKTAKVKALLITGGHDHDAAFYGLFQGYDELDRLPVVPSATAFKDDIRGKYDVVIMYDFTREIDDPAKKNLRDYVESGGGVVVLHHALLNYQSWAWWDDEAVGGSYRLSRSGNTPSSSVKDDQQIDVTLAGEHPVLAGLGPFHIQDEAYKNLRMSPKIRPLMTTNNPTSDPNLAWVGPLEGSKVVAIQLGHGPSAFGNPSYRTLVHNAVVWAAGKTK